MPVFLIGQCFADPGVSRVASCLVKLAIEEVKGVCPQSMFGTRDKLILCMDRPRERLSSGAWRPMVIRDLRKQHKVKE
jgi:hypothetical protein